MDGARGWFQNDKEEGLNLYPAISGGGPIEGVDVLGAAIAEEQRGIVGREGKGAAELAGGDEVLETYDFLDGAIADAKLDDSAIFGEIEEVERLAVLGPIEPTQGSFGDDFPFLSLQIEEFKAAGVAAEGDDGFPVGGPAGRKETL